MMVTVTGHSKVILTLDGTWKSQRIYILSAPWDLGQLELWMSGTGISEQRCKCRNPEEVSTKNFCNPHTTAPADSHLGVLMSITRIYTFDSFFKNENTMRRYFKCTIFQKQKVQRWKHKQLKLQLLTLKYQHALQQIISERGLCKIFIKI